MHSKGSGPNPDFFFFFFHKLKVGGSSDRGRIAVLGLLLVDRSEEDLWSDLTVCFYGILIIRAYSEK